MKTEKMIIILIAVSLVILTQNISLIFNENHRIKRNSADEQEFLHTDDNDTSPIVDLPEIPKDNNTSTFIKRNDDTISNEPTWYLYKFDVNKKTTFNLNLDYRSDYDSDKLLFTGSYIFPEIYEPNPSLVNSLSNAFGNGNAQSGYITSTNGYMDQEFYWNGSVFEGTATLKLMIFNKPLHTGTWYFVFCTNAPHVLNITMNFTESVNIKQSNGNDSIFIYQSRDFQSVIGVGGYYGNIHYNGSLTHASEHTFIGSFWAERPNNPDVGRTKISFHSPSGKKGTRTYQGDGQRTNHEDTGDFVDQLIGPSGDWKFNIDYEIDNDKVLLAGVCLRDINLVENY